MIKPTIWNFLILIFICQSISEPLNDSCPRLIRKTTEICNQSLGPKSVIDYKYDAKGRNCYIVKYYGHSLYKELYEYDRKDRLVKQINMKNGKITTTKRIEYNAEGKKLKVTVYDSSEALTNIKYHYYDIKSKRVTINEFIPDSILISQCLEDYDKWNHLIQWTSIFAHSGTMVKSTETKPRENIPLKNTNINSKENEYTRESLKYDSAGVHLMFIYNHYSSSNQIARVEEFLYDDAGRLKTENYYETGKEPLYVTLDSGDSGARLSVTPDLNPTLYHWKLLISTENVYDVSGNKIKSIVTPKFSGYRCSIDTFEYDNKTCNNKK